MLNIPAKSQCDNYCQILKSSENIWNGGTKKRQVFEEPLTHENPSEYLHNS